MYVDTPKKRQKDYTNLEMEAMALVNEDLPGPKVTDQEKYEEILNQRKERKAVSLENLLHFFAQTFIFYFLFKIIFE